MTLPARLRRQISESTQYLQFAGEFRLESGAILPGVQVAYRTWGDLRNSGGRAVLICHALTGSADAEAWWPQIIGPGRALDPATDFIVCSNILGGCYGTTGPLSLRESGERYAGEFPAVSIRDMVRLQRHLLDALGVTQLELVTGPSLGGMQALEWAVMYPDFVETIVPIGVGAQHSAWCIAISEAQRAAIFADPNWQGGDYVEAARPLEGLAAARMMAICTYRSWQSFGDRFSRSCRADGLFEAQSYLRHQGTKINERFDANTYVTLTHAMHSHDLARDRGTLPEVLNAVQQPALVISVSSDALYPPAEQAALAKLLPNSNHEFLESIHGHDGFLIESLALGDLLAAFRRQCRQQSLSPVIRQGAA